MWQSHQLLWLIKEGGGLRRDEKILKSVQESEELLSHFSSRDISREGREEGLVQTKFSGILRFMLLHPCSREFRMMLRENIR